MNERVPCMACVRMKQCAHNHCGTEVIIGINVVNYVELEDSARYTRQQQLIRLKFEMFYYYMAPLMLEQLPRQLFTIAIIIPCNNSTPGI
jgi:hypothetical protein